MYKKHIKGMSATKTYTDNYTLKCPLCGTGVRENSFLRTHSSSYTGQTYKLYRCSNCHLEFWEPLKIVPAFYEDEILDSYVSIHSGTSKIAIHHKLFFKYFLKLEKKGYLLDIGCGNGGFLSEVQKYGFEGYGIDFDKNSIRTAKEKFGLEHVYKTSIEEFVENQVSDGRKFDVITIFEVLEHQDNPKKLFQQIKMLLKPDGFIAGSVPNRRRPFVKLERQRNNGDYPPHHFLYLSKDVLKRFLMIEGFNKISLYPVSPVFGNMPAYIEHLLFGGFTKNIKQRLKGYTIKNSNKAKLSLHELSRSNNDQNAHSINLLILLKVIRDIIFLPLSLPVYLFMRIRGYQIYFQAQYSKGHSDGEK